jgi:hypothetical protein
VLGSTSTREGACSRRCARERLGFGSFVEYIERLFGYAPRLTHDKLRVAEALEELPELGKALREGQASWSWCASFRASRRTRPSKLGSKSRAAAPCAR